MSSVAHSPPEQGQLVSVRSRQGIVNDVCPSTLSTPPRVTGWHKIVHRLSMTPIKVPLNGPTSRTMTHWPDSEG
jgi:hypothetical protein